MPLGTEVGIDPGDNVLAGDPASPVEMGTSAPTFRAFRPVSIVAKRSPVSATAERLLLESTRITGHGILLRRITQNMRNGHAERTYIETELLYCGCVLDAYGEDQL